MAHAASSITVTPRGAQTASIASTSAGMPAWSTTITARVAGVSASATVSGVRFCVSTSTSANTGRAPTYRGALAVAMNDRDGTTTSSPGPTPRAWSARCSAVVHDVVATPCSAPSAAQTADSKAATCGPWATHPEASTPATARSSSAPSQGRMIGIRSMP